MKSHPRLGLNSLRTLIPIHWTALIVRLVGHVTSERCMMSEHGILRQRLPRPHCFEELPHVRLEVIVIVSLVADCLGSGLLSRLGIVLRVPLLEIRIFETRRQSVAI